MPLWPTRLAKSFYISLLKYTKNRVSYAFLIQVYVYMCIHAYAYMDICTWAYTIDLSYMWSVLSYNWQCVDIDDYVDENKYDTRTTKIYFEFPWIFVIHLKFYKNYKFNYFYVDFINTLYKCWTFVCKSIYVYIYIYMYEGSFKSKIQKRV